MKHLKLFVEFTERYDQLIEFADKGAIRVENVQQLNQVEHVKLFEEYTKFSESKRSSPYEKTSDLPFFGYCEVDNDQSIAVQMELLNKGYRNFPDYSSPQKYYHNVLDPKGKNLIAWNGRRKEISLESFSDRDMEYMGSIVKFRVYYGYDGMATPPPFKLVKFDDYFKPKDTHKGYVHGKIFGL